MSVLLIDSLMQAAKHSPYDRGQYSYAQAVIQLSFAEGGYYDRMDRVRLTRQLKHKKGKRGSLSLSAGVLAASKSGSGSCVLKLIEATCTENTKGIVANNSRSEECQCLVCKGDGKSLSKSKRIPRSNHFHTKQQDQRKIIEHFFVERPL